MEKIKEKYVFYIWYTILNQITIWKKKKKIGEEDEKNTICLLYLVHDLEPNNNLKKNKKKLEKRMRKIRWKGKKLHKKEEKERKWKEIVNLKYLKKIVK